MTDIRTILEERLQAAFDTVEAGADPVLRPSDHADFQVNGTLPLAKRLGRNPRELAEGLLAAVDLGGICETVEVSGPGFLNLTLSAGFLADQLQAMAADEALGLAPTADPVTVVVDYSAPNVAKEMHVGHLRSTIIGDALVRLLQAAGHEVVRENHVGDWGTPFGMLIEHLLDLGEEEATSELSVGDLDGFYRQARASFDADEAFAARARARVVLLQSGDPETLRLWGILVGQSIAYFDEVYAKLGVLLTDADVVGESFYNPMLEGVVADLEALGLLVENDGARCVFPPGFANRQGDPLPLIIRKSDGGYGYAATDLAAIRDRVDRLGAGRILYVVGAPQAQHLQMCFAVARLAGWLPEGVEAVHVAFGSVLGPDRKVFRTRAGSTVKLVDLLDEAVARAAGEVAERNPDLDEGTRRDMARALGVGAVKYADLSNDRAKDYVFDMDRMLAAQGDTGPYLQYAHARVRNIFARGEVDPPPAGSPLVLAEPAERALGLRLLRFGDAVAGARQAADPHRLCLFLYETASAFSSFYDHCPVLKAPDGPTRLSRLALADLTARVLARGLGLLGIEAPDRM